MRDHICTSLSLVDLHVLPLILSVHVNITLSSTNLYITTSFKIKFFTKQNMFNAVQKRFGIGGQESL